MQKTELRFLIIDDSEADRLLATRELKAEFPTARVQEIGEEAGLTEAFNASFDLLVTDYQLRWTTGLEVLRRAKQQFPEIPVIMFTASGDQEVAVEAMKAGASDYVVKSASNLQRLRYSARAALERVRHLRVLKETERLAVVGRLMATVAHEINNPLETLINVLYLIEQNPNRNDIRELAGTAREQLTRIEQITSRTLGFYRESERPVTLSVPSIIDDVLLLYESRLQVHGIKVHRQYTDGRILAFPGEMRQVFSNLISNAIHAMPRGGSLDIKVESKSDGRDHVCVYVCDEGYGIRPEHMSKVFEPFFTTKGEEGTGLGLWVTHGIIAKHGGTIKARGRNEKGLGACFEISLPRAAQKPMGVETANGEARQEEA
jgi:signal transduction histidine kinase